MPCHAVPDEQALDRLVLRLTALKAPKLFIWFVVLVYFQEEMWPQAPMPFEAVEFFCGDSAVTKRCRRAYIVTAGLDIENAENRRPYRKQNPFDLSTAAGFAPLGGWYSPFST
jgi:hypothetical protein